MLKRTISAAISKTKKSVLLLGPRQTGKSTLIKALKPDLSINLALETNFLKFAREPNELPLQLAASQARTIFIDEVQRLPSLLNTIQALLDDAPVNTLKFYLTGSSARKLKRGEANLLPGRIIKFDLGSLTAAELAYELDIAKALAYGTLPGIYLEHDRHERQQILTTYASTYVKEEVQAEALTRNIEGFSRFLYVVAARNSEFVDFNKLASDAAIQRKTARRYFDILEETMIIHRVEAFAKSSYRRLIQHPKFFFFDNGVLNALLGSFDVTADRKGMLYESLVYNQLLFSFAAHCQSNRISSYRTENGAEVDLIVEHNQEVWAIEIKASKNVASTDLTGLKSFAQFFGKPHRAVVIYLGDDVKMLGDVWVTPLQTFLREAGL